MTIENIPVKNTEVYETLTNVIKKDSFCIVAIGGKPYVGKSRLSRYLSWKLNVSLLEADLFLRKRKNKVEYDYSYIKEILRIKKMTKRPIIIEGCSILPVLHEFDCNEKFLIYIENQITSTHDKSPVDQSNFENTKICSINEILEYDKPSDFKTIANLTINQIEINLYKMN